MTTKVVLRVLDASGRMLGGVEHAARLPGDGTVRAAGPVAVPVTAPGWPSVLSIHWCDPHVEVRSALPATPAVSVADVVTVAQAGAPLIVVGQPPVEPLEPLVVGRAVVAVPVAGLGAGA